MASAGGCSWGGSPVGVDAILDEPDCMLPGCAELHVKQGSRERERELARRGFELSSLLFLNPATLEHTGEAQSQFESRDPDCLRWPRAGTALKPAESQIVISLARTRLSNMQSVNRFLFGPTPEERVKKWQQQLKTESRALDREIRQLDLASNKVKADVKKLAQKGETKNAKLLAREVVRSNKQKDRLHTSQARLNSINMQLSHQLGQ